MRSERLGDYGFVLLAATLWATIGLFYRYLEAQGLSRLTIAFCRASVAAVLLLVGLGWRNPQQLRIQWRDLPLFLALGFFGVAAFYVVYVYAIALAGMGVAAILMYTAPAWVAVLGAIFLGEPMDRRKGVALVLAVAGCALIGRVYDLGGVRFNLAGLLTGLGAGLTYGLYTIFSKLAVRRYTAWTTLAYGVAVGAVFMLPLQSPEGLARAVSSLSVFGVVMGLGLLPTVAAGVAFNLGLERVPASNASIVATLEPALATLLGWLFLGERMELVQVVGGAFVLVAVVILQRGETSNVKRQTSGVKRQASSVKRQASNVRCRTFDAQRRRFSMELPKTAEVVIIGGGVMGTSTAYHLALKGCKDVLLLEREEFFGVQATGKCAGGIRYQFGTEINVRLSLLSLPMLDRFEEELGQPIDLKYCGYLFLLTREEDVAAFRHNMEMQHRLGVETEWLTPEEIARMVPLIDLEGVLAGTFYARDGLADPNSVVQGYVSGARRLGAKLLAGVGVTDVLVEGGRVRGVVTGRGTVSAPVVVNAAGPWAGEVGRMAGVEIPIVPLRRQIVVTSPLPEVPPDFPFVIDFAQSLYFHREGQGILTGMSNPNEKVGFDQSVDPEWELVHLEAAMKRMPLLEKAGLASHWAGLYEVSPDAHPILGRIPEVEGFYCIGGFSGHGFMHGPACGLLLAEEIVDGRAHTLDIAPLSIERFRQGKEIREYNVV